MCKLLKSTPHPLFKFRKVIKPQNNSLQLVNVAQKGKWETWWRCYLNLMIWNNLESCSLGRGNEYLYKFAVTAFMHNIDGLICAKYVPVLQTFKWECKYFCF